MKHIIIFHVHVLDIEYNIGTQRKFSQLVGILPEKCLQGFVIG